MHYKEAQYAYECRLFLMALAATGKLTYQEDSRLTTPAGDEWNHGLPEVAFNSRHLHGLSHHARQSERHLFRKLLTVHAGLQGTRQTCQGLPVRSQIYTIDFSRKYLAKIALESIIVAHESITCVTHHYCAEKLLP